MIYTVIIIVSGLIPQKGYNSANNWKTVVSGDFYPFILHISLARIRICC